MSARNNDVWTVQKKFGFADDDLKTSEHDKIMMWADEKMPAILNWFFKPSEWDKEDIRWAKEHIEESKQKKISDTEYTIQRLKSRISADSFVDSREEDSAQLAMCQKELGKWNAHVIPETFPDIPDIIHNETIWEYVISTQNGNRGNQYTVGFIDLVAKFSVPVLWGNGKSLEYEVGYRDSAAFFEVKSTVDSLGQLIRQVRLYQQYVGKDNWFVIAPDDSFKEPLKKQGIEFIKYKG